VTSMSTTPIDLDRPGGPRRWGMVFAVVWLFYLLNPLEAGWEKRDTVAGWVGIVATLLFAITYVGAFVLLRNRRPGAPFRATTSTTLGLGAVGVEIALGVVVCLAVGQPGSATAVYVAVLSMLCLGPRLGWAVVALVAGSTYAATLLVDSWDPDRGILFGTLAAALAIWGISQAINRNIEVLAVREENARLALEDERNRFARDLHDILGHSLTVITVKAELAQKLFDVDPERARAEVTDLERLSRDALADVRRAVDGYREMSLAGELARARSALASAEIAAELPGSTDEVRGDLRELFAWVVREGVTNVIRHSGARRCVVSLRSDGVVVEDDGGGAAGGVPLGHGLAGLRERAAAAGAVLLTSDVQPSGFRLEVAVR